MNQHVHPCVQILLTLRGMRIFIDRLNFVRVFFLDFTDLLVAVQLVLFFLRSEHLFYSVVFLLTIFDFLLFSISLEI
jgi:hypothetical protein